MGLCTEQNVIHHNTTLASYVEMRLTKISAELSLKHAEGCGRISQVTTQMTNAVNTIKSKLGDNPSSEDYRQNMAECESTENEYQVIIDNIRDQMEAAEERLQLEQETNENKLEVIREEQETWKEARDNTIEKTFKYFD